jgi:hypothetical protein
VEGREACLGEVLCIVAVSVVLEAIGCSSGRAILDVLGLDISMDLGMRGYCVRRSSIALVTASGLSAQGNEQSE